MAPSVPCFACGTLIATPDGERPVETLAIGDLVTTMNGTAPVRWIGRKTRHVRFARRVGEGLPRP